MRALLEPSYHLTGRPATSRTPPAKASRRPVSGDAGSQSACKAACDAFAGGVLEVAGLPVKW